MLLFLISQLELWSALMKNDKSQLPRLWLAYLVPLQHERMVKQVFMFLICMILERDFIQNEQSHLDYILPWILSKIELQTLRI